MVISRTSEVTSSLKSVEVLVEIYKNSAKYYNYFSRINLTIVQYWVYNIFVEREYYTESRREVYNCKNSIYKNATAIALANLEYVLITF